MRFEIWSNVQCAAGARLAVVANPLAASDMVSLTGQHDRAVVEFALSDPAFTSAQVGRVLRVVYDDSTQFDEWRLVGVHRAVDSGRRVRLEAEPVILDLRRGLVQRTEADGTGVVDFELVGLSPAALVAVILGSAPTYFAAGTIEPTDLVDGLAFSVDTPLSALRELAELTASELAVRRNGTTSYLVDLVTTFNGAATPIHFRPAKNLQSYQYEIDAEDQATRVYPVGQVIDDIHMTIAEAEWKVVSVTTNDVVLVDPGGTDGPIAYDDQFNGTYLERVDGTLTQITDTIASSQTVVVASGTGIAPNDRIRLRRNSAGDDLLYLDAPAELATYGLHVAVVERRDIPPVRNLMNNPMLTGTYVGGVPPHWSKIGAPTAAENTNALYTQFGGKSSRITATVAGEGLQSPELLKRGPTVEAPYFSGYFMLWVLSGAVRVELVDLTNSRTYPTGAEGRAVTTEKNVWVALGLAGIDLYAVGCQSAVLRVLSDTPSGADFYVDAAQWTNSPAQQPFFAGDGAVRLWFEGLNHLLDFAAPQVTVEVSALDLTRTDPVAWPFDAVLLGGPARVVDADAGVDVSTRVLQRDRDLLHRSVTRVQLSNRPDTLTDRIVRPTRRKRFGQDAGARFDEVGIADPAIGPAQANASSITYPVSWDPDTAYVRVYSVETSGATPPTPPESGEYFAGDYAPTVGSIVIATTASWYRKSVFIAFRKDGIRGRTVTLGPTQAVNAGSGPSAGPSGLACGASTATTIALSWTNNDSTAQTRVYRDGVLIDTVAAGTASYTATGLTPTTSYAFKVAHVKNDQEHATVSTATCSTSSQGLAAPADLHAFGDTVDGVLLSADVTEPTAHTIIERSPNGSTGWVEIADWPPGQCGGDHADGSGLFYFRAKHRKQGFSDSAATANNTATYYNADTPESFYPCP